MQHAIYAALFCYVTKRYVTQNVCYITYPNLPDAESVTDWHWCRSAWPRVAPGISASQAFVASLLRLRAATVAATAH